MGIYLKLSLWIVYIQIINQQFKKMKSFKEFCIDDNMIVNLCMHISIGSSVFAKHFMATFSRGIVWQRYIGGGGADQWQTPPHSWHFSVRGRLLEQLTSKKDLPSTVIHSGVLLSMGPQLTTSAISLKALVSLLGVNIKPLMNKNDWGKWNN